MISIVDKQDCVGCSACVSVCPKKCISFEEDDEGFLYPKVNESLCVNCGLCDRVCPVIQSGEQHRPIDVFSAKNEDSDVLMQSSSGGVFYAMARKVIEDGGVVFGAQFDDTQVVEHSYTDTIDDLKRFQGSKYSQSVMGGSFTSVKKFLDAGRKVMFTGTPCQVAGLRLYLRKDYGDLLLLVDVICHGVPSPLVWRKYLDMVAEKHGGSGAKIKKVTFRDKRLGWENYGMAISFGGDSAPTEYFENHEHNIFMRGFLKNFYLRPSCFACPAKGGRAGSDVTLGDFWGIKQVAECDHDDKGVSVLLIHTDKGARAVNNCGVSLKKSDYESALRYNSAISESVPPTKWQKCFWREWQRKGVEAIEYTLKKSNPCILKRAWRKLGRIVKRILK